MERLQCWEFRNCGREPGGWREAEQGICPACTTWDRDGVNHGIAAGRSCWTVEGTLCPGPTSRKFCACMDCDFFQVVCDQEGRDFSLGFRAGSPPEESQPEP